MNPQIKHLIVQFFFVRHKTLTQTSCGRQLHEHHNHVFSLPQIYLGVRFFDRFNTISLYGHIGPTLQSEPLAQVPYVVIGLHRHIYFFHNMLK